MSSPQAFDSGPIFDLAERCNVDPNYFLDDADKAVIAEGLSTERPDVRRINVWRVGLFMIYQHRVAAPELLDLVPPVAAAVLAHDVVDREVMYTTGQQLLEVLFALLVEMGELDLTRRVLSEISQAANAMLLRSGISPSLLTAKRIEGDPMGVAANAAFAHEYYELAVEAAESARHKFLTALAARKTLGSSAIGAPIDVTSFTKEVMRAAFPDEGADDVPTQWTTIRQTPPIPRLVARPWVRLAAFGSSDERPKDAAIDDDIWNMALLEPDFDRIMGALQSSSRMLIYLFLQADLPGCVMLAPQSLAVLTVDEESPLSADGDDEYTRAFLRYVDIGRRIALRLAGLSAEHGLGYLSNVLFVDWNGSWSDELSIVVGGFNDTQDLLTDDPGRFGPWTQLPAAVIPSARNLFRSSPRSAALPDVPTVCFLGDPTENLPGPWVESLVLRRYFGTAVACRMGAEATSEELYRGLRAADLLIVSAHAGFDESRLYLSLADGEVSAQELLDNCEPGSMPRAVMLSCCTAGRADVQPAHTELFGIVTTLLALGVEEVLAPAVTVSDIAAAVLTCEVARFVSEGLSLREAFGAARSQIWRAVSGGVKTLDLPFFDDAAVPPAFPHDVAAARASVALIQANVVLATTTRYHLYGGI